MESIYIVNKMKGIYMAEYTQKDNSFIMFTNNKKTKENSPDFTGNLIINGKKYIMSCWEKTAKNGQPFLSGLINEAFNKDSNQGELIPNKEFNDSEKTLEEDTSGIPF